MSDDIVERWISVLDHAPTAADANSCGEVLSFGDFADGEPPHMKVTAWKYLAPGVSITHWRPLLEPPKSLVQQISEAVIAAVGPTTKLYLGSRQYAEVLSIFGRTLNLDKSAAPLKNQFYFTGLRVYQVEVDDYLAVGN